MAELTSADDDQRRAVVLPVTSAHDGLEHLVPEHMMTIGNAVTEARPVTLVRYRPGVTGETARTVHLIPLPVGGSGGAVTALCGASLSCGDIELVTGTLLLPPTVTTRGPITWTQLPEPDALRLCREIDVLAALRTALNDPPTPH